MTCAMEGSHPTTGAAGGRCGSSHDVKRDPPAASASPSGRLPGVTTADASARPRADVAAVRFFLLFLGTLFGCELVIMLALTAILPRDTSPWVGSLADAAMLTAVLAPLLWWLFVRPAQRLTESRRLLLERVLFAQEEERRRIAADLHDGLGQSLTSVLLRLAAIEQEATVPNVRSSAAATRDVVSHALDEIRRLVRDTRPPVLDDLGLVAAVEKLLEDIATAAGLESSFSSRDDVGGRLPPAVETTVFRVVQEALTNAVRHANCRRITVEIGVGPSEIRATIRDDGTGFDVAATLQDSRRPFGLLSMRERVEPFGGSVSITSRRDRGTVVEVRLPLSGHGGHGSAT